MDNIERLQARREANKAMRIFFLDVGKDNRAQLSCFGEYLEALDLYNTAACLLVGYTQRMLALSTTCPYEQKGTWHSEGLPNTYLESFRLAQTPSDPWADEVGYAVWCDHMVHSGYSISGVRNAQKAMAMLCLRMGAGTVSYRLLRTTRVGSTHYVSLHRLILRALALAEKEGVSISNAARLLAFTEKLKDCETMLVLAADEVSL